MIIQLYLYLLIWCRAAETLTDQRTDLGQNVTINCDLNEEEVYWFSLKLQDSAVLIMRSIRGKSPFYFNKRFRLRYSVDSKNHLFINNVTVDELGVYYCMSTGSDPQFSNANRLHIIEPTPLTECQNHTVVQYIQQNQTEVKYIQQNQTEVKYIQQNQTSWQTLCIISALFNAVLIVVVIGHTHNVFRRKAPPSGLLKVCAVRRSAEQQLHNTDVQPTPDLQQHLDPNQLQHAEVASSMLCTNIHPVPVDGTYVTLQLPK